MFSCVTKERKVLVDNIRHYMKLNDNSIQDIATILNVSSRTVRNRLDFNSKYPFTVDELTLLANFWGLDIIDLVSVQPKTFEELVNRMSDINRKYRIMLLKLNKKVTQN